MDITTPIYIANGMITFKGPETVKLIDKIFESNDNLDEQNTVMHLLVGHDESSGIMEYSLSVTWRDLFNNKDNHDMLYSLYETLNSILSSPCFIEFKPVSIYSMDEYIKVSVLKTNDFEHLNEDVTPFYDKLKDNNIAVFPNLSGDAILIVPNKVSRAHNSNLSIYHLFKNATPDFMIKMLNRLITTVYENIERFGKIYVSTSGLGVHWIHIRLDKTPKYYKNTSYV